MLRRARVTPAAGRIAVAALYLGLGMWTLFADACVSAGSTAAR